MKAVIKYAVLNEGGPWWFPIFYVLGRRFEASPRESALIEKHALGTRVGLHFDTECHFDKEAENEMPAIIAREYPLRLADLLSAEFSVVIAADPSSLKSVAEATHRHAEAWTNFLAGLPDPWLPADH